jgi:hypothetical protein
MARKGVGGAEGMEDFGECDALHTLGDSAGTRPCAAVIHVTTSGMNLYLILFSQSFRVWGFEKSHLCRFKCLITLFLA